MKALFCLLFFAGFVSFQAVAGNRCRRGIQFCAVNNTETGEIEDVQYDDCVQFCCGRVLYERDIYFECCGDKEAGVPYSRNTQLCCSWPAGNEFAIYDQVESVGAYCCGTSLMRQNMSSTHSCCNSYHNRPQTFNHRTEMCCNGNVAFAADTAYTSCCGNTSYDRRVASCPCHNGVVGVGIPKVHAVCCSSPDQRVRNPYNFLTQSCCNGFPYFEETQFCCDGQVGTSSTEVCCGSTIVSRSTDFLDAEVACCELLDESNVVYDVQTSICCAGALSQRDQGLLGDVICCGDTMYNVSESGDACCGDVPYSIADSVCCNGLEFPGDECCAGEGFSSAGQLCCAEGVVSHNFEKPGCCYNESFNAVAQTCCGFTVFENPQVQNELGVFETSRHTRCCGDFSDSSTLIPYDYFTQTCCAGVVVDLGDIPWNSAQCCGEELHDDDLYTCCDGNRRIENIFGSATECCGIDAINGTSSICCNGVGVSRTGGTEDECCGPAAIDPNVDICCDGVPRSLNGVSRENAICCGDGCIDGMLYWCCDGKQYRKGSSDGIDVSNLECTDLFPTDE